MATTRSAITCDRTGRHGDAVRFTLTGQGDHGRGPYLLLDGVVTVSVDDEVVAEIGSEAVLGERSAIAHGCRTSTVTARTTCRWRGRTRAGPSRSKAEPPTSPKAWSPRSPSNDPDRNRV